MLFCSYKFDSVLTIPRNLCIGLTANKKGRPKESDIADQALGPSTDDLIAVARSGWGPSAQTAAAAMGIQAASPEDKLSSPAQYDGLCVDSFGESSLQKCSGTNIVGLVNPSFEKTSQVKHNHAINAQATQVTAPRATAAALDNFAARFQKISKA